ncbi:carboxymuconolactone decarboxylase family protein [Ampullimonas aquatilis]|uniref:carboxymuconolactone decarboxylase family protein n=1 Tax=Ampullimonas aquatilis TaxID=1341549 RepID=UPI003C78E66D
MSTLRLAYDRLCPELTQTLRSMVTQLEQSSLGVPLIELIYQRVSQINGCAFCLDKHSRVLRSHGETNQRLDTLAAWRDSRHFEAREKAALAWAEAITHVAVSHPADAIYLPLKEHFTEVAITELTFAIVTMNALNRLVISLGR